jgi:hypothetical protein
VEEVTTPAARRYAEFVVARSHGNVQQSGPSWVSRETLRRLGMAGPEIERYWRRWDERLAAETARVGEEP